MTLIDSKRAGVDALHDCCGVAAVFNHPEAATLVYLALYALQHRGQEAAGIVSGDGVELHRHAGLGLVADVFPHREQVALPGCHAIGHVRYGTSGWSSIENAQPLVIRHHRGGLALAHNGNLVNALALRAALERTGSIFRTTTDTEVILHLVARSQAVDAVDALVEALQQVKGAYSLVMADERRVFVARDPHGFRPLSLGRLPGGQPVIASESCAFDLLGARFERDIEPGEVLVLDETEAASSRRPFASQPPAPCVFEYVYFARPDSMVFGRAVAEVRRGLGRELAREHPAPGDLVVPAPDSGVPAAIGYAQESGIAFDVGLTRNHYVGRTFIEPAQSIRHFGVKVKLNPVRALIKGRRIVLVDDSIVRGTTMAKIVNLLRGAGAREVHVRVSCPPTIAPCHYGVDTPSREELIAANHSLADIRERLGADSLGYLSLDGLHRGVGATVGSLCAACYTGQCPVPVSDGAELRSALRAQQERRSPSGAPFGARGK